METINQTQQHVNPAHMMGNAEVNVQFNQMIAADPELALMQEQQRQADGLALGFLMLAGRFASNEQLFNGLVKQAVGIHYAPAAIAAANHARAEHHDQFLRNQQDGIDEDDN